jgi:hypothetical protein
VVIQSAWRAERNRRNKAAHPIQSIARGWLARAHALLVLQAAVQIQSCARRKLAYKKIQIRRREEFAGDDAGGGRDGRDRGDYSNDRNGRTMDHEEGYYFGDTVSVAENCRSSDHLFDDSNETYAAFTKQGFALSALVLEAVKRAENIAAKIEEDFMGKAEPQDKEEEEMNSCHYQLMQLIQRSTKN